jgi:hypothetical protein
MAKRDIDQPEAQRGGRDREMNETRDENTAGGAEDVRGIAGDEEDDFEDDDAEDLEEEDTEDM